MKNIISIVIVALFATSVMAQNNSSDEKKYGLAVGTSISAIGGLGLQVVGSYNNKFAARILYEGYRYKPDTPYEYISSDETNQDVKLNVYPDVKFGGLSLLFDYYLFRSFYITGGFVKTNLQPNAKIVSAQDMVINNVTYTPEELGEAHVSLVNPTKVAPYIGFGLGRNIKSRKGLTFNFELGTAFTKPYELQVESTKHFKNDNDINESVKDVNQKIKEMSWSGFIPTIKIGISYRFM